MKKEYLIIIQKLKKKYPENIAMIKNYYIGLTDVLAKKENDISLESSYILDFLLTSVPTNISFDSPFIIDFFSLENERLINKYGQEAYENFILEAEKQKEGAKRK